MRLSGVMMGLLQLLDFAINKNTRQFLFIELEAQAHTC